MGAPTGPGSAAEHIARWSAIPPDVLAAMDPEGDFTKKYLLNPTVFGLLGDVAGLAVLDAGAGQGYFSRLLARRGASVTAVEPAAGLIAHARESEAREPLGVRLVQADLTTATFEPVFDVVVANMVLLTIADWTAAVRTCVGALRPGGTLVFAVDHPCFETGERDLGPAPHLEIRDYLTERPLARPVAPDFHRTVSTYVNGALAAGLVVTGVEEPGLPDAALADPDAPPEADLLRRVPSLLVVRCRKPSEPS